MLTLRVRPGTTLAELLVAITAGTIVLAIIATIALRGQRFFIGLGDVMSLTSELHETAAILPVDLRGIAIAGGDLRAGEARDTSIEIRGTVASAVVCDTTGGRAVLAPAGAGAFAGVLSHPQEGDTAWILMPSDTEVWDPHRLAEVSSVAAGRCDPLGPTLSETDQASPRIALRLDGVPSPAVLVGLPLRITRLARYSLYRSSDGAWYLGQREWNAANGRFNTIQPVSGPFASPASGGLRLSYFDSLGAALAPPVSNTLGIAMIRVVMRAETERIVQIPGLSVDASGRRAESTQISIGLRNRR